MKMKSLLSVGALASLSLTSQSNAVMPVASGGELVAPLFAADQGETRAVLMIKGGKIAAKRYGEGYSDANRFISWSMAKTVTAVLIGELVADGKLSLDAPAPIAEWQGVNDPRGTITLRQMLHMSAGLSHTEEGEPITRSDTNQTLFVNGTDAMAARAIAKPLEAKPGAKYEYSSLTSLLLSEIITRTLTSSADPIVRAKAYTAFATERLFKPAGISSAVFDFDGAGTQIGGSIIYMTLDDWGRFGQVLLSGKDASGGQLIVPEWLSFLRAPAATDGGYGGHVWLNRPRPPGSNPALFPGNGPSSLFAAVGHLGQYVIVSPDQNLVLVRLGKTNDPMLGPVRAALGAVVAKIPPEEKP